MFVNDSPTRLKRFPDSFKTTPRDDFKLKTIKIHILC